MVHIAEIAIDYIKKNIKGFIEKGKGLMEKSCKTCTYYPCTRINCGKVCNQYKTEVQEILEGIDKILEEGYQDWERTKIGGNMKKGEEKTLLEIIEEIAKGKIKTDLYLHYEYGLYYTFYIDSFKLIADNGTGLIISKVLNDKFKLEHKVKEE